jgi:hypothetical protein
VQYNGFAPPRHVDWARDTVFSDTSCKTSPR